MFDRRCFQSDSGLPGSLKATRPILSLPYRCWIGKKNFTVAIRLKPALMAVLHPKTTLKKAKSHHDQRCLFCQKARSQRNRHVPQSICLPSACAALGPELKSGISWLKRCLGLTRCNWKGWDSFKSYVVSERKPLILLLTRDLMSCHQ